MSLAETITSLDTEFEVDVVSREPLRTRVSYLLDNKYDLVQVDELLVNGVLALGGLLLSGTPFVASVRGWADYSNAHNQYGRLRDLSIRLRTRAVLRATSETMFLSERTREEFLEHYNVVSSSVVNRPINVEYYQGSQSRDNNSTEFNLLTVTNLRYKEKYKGVKTILQGLTDLFECSDNLHYSIAGDGAYQESLEHFLDSYPYSDRVRVLGYQKDVPKLLHSADAFVYVSYLDSFGTVVLEAQAAGLPVVAGDASGVSEALSDVGILCEPTPEGVYDAVNRLFEDDDLRAELSEKSVSKMETYNEKCARRHIEVWDDVLGYSR